MHLHNESEGIMNESKQRDLSNLERDKNDFPTSLYHFALQLYYWKIQPINKMDENYFPFPEFGLNI